MTHWRLIFDHKLAGRHYVSRRGWRIRVEDRAGKPVSLLRMSDSPVELRWAFEDAQDGEEAAAKPVLDLIRDGWSVTVRSVQSAEIRQKKEA